MSNITVPKESLAILLTNWMILEARNNCVHGNWIITYEEIEQIFGIDISKDDELIEAISNCFISDMNCPVGIVADFEVNSDGFDFVLYSDFY